jgi:hypothetical protein
MPRFSGPAHQRAIASLDDALERFREAGYAHAERLSPLQARLRSLEGRRPLGLVITREGRVFGGNYALEIATDEPVLPSTRGLSARGRGIVHMRGVSFRARRGDEAGASLARRLANDSLLAERLGKVHFERIRVEPDGRPVIRHLGGSVVWILFPPIVRKIPLIATQVQATLAALEAFASVGCDQA